jgi:phytoene desaturase
MSSTKKQAVVIGCGFGGLAMGIRLQSLGFNTTIVEKLDGPGGRAYVRKQDGFTFDMGPTVITVPHFIEELFSLEPNKSMLDEADFPASILGENSRVKEGISGGPNTSKYVKIVPIIPFYRIYFDDDTFFDYDGDPDHAKEQITKLAPEDIIGFDNFQRDAKAIFERGFLEIGYTHFGDISSLVKVLPELWKLDAIRNLFSFVKKYFKNPKMQQVFSFETLLIGGNPLSVPAMYAMIHLVERTWGIHFAMGGTGALVNGLAKKFEDMGGKIRYESEVKEINIIRENGKNIAKSVTLADNTCYLCDLVVSNGDWANTYMKLINPKFRFWNSDWRIKHSKQSMSLVVIYFGFRADGNEFNKLRHHNIILGPRYEELLKDIFGRKILAKDFSQYLHIPTLTDPSLAPDGCHAAYTLIPVPNTDSNLDWDLIGEPFTDKILRFLDEKGYIPGLMDRLITKSYISPDYFNDILNSFKGNAFGPEPVLTQTAFFRPHNKSEDIENLYLAGAGSQPGAGTPSVMMAAKITARLISNDFIGSNQE